MLSSRLESGELVQGMYGDEISFCAVVNQRVMPYAGDEFHHFGWNACSSALAPMSGHAFLQRRYLIIPGNRSSRIYIVDTQPDPGDPKLVKTIKPEELMRNTRYSRPNTVHCGLEGICVYRYLGLRFLRRAWLNPDLVWGASLVLAGGAGIALAL